MTGRRVEITINVATLHAAGAVVNFPRVLTRAVLPDEMFDADGASPALANGGDVWASLDGTAGTRIPLDLVFFDTDNDPANGTAEIWVRMPDDEAATVWIHWGGAQTAQPDRDSTYGGDAVWSEDFGAVWRLHEDPQVITTILDRTGQGHTATFATEAVWYQATQPGMLNPCYECLNGDGLRFTPFLSDAYSQSTISMQIESSSDTNVGLWGEGSGAPAYWAIFTNGGGSGVIRTDLVDGTGGHLTTQTGDVLPASTPFDFSVVRSGNDATDLAIYVDAVDEAVSFSGTGATSTFSPDSVGYAVNNLEGYASIVVVATVARDGAWLTAWALMLADPTDGITTGTPEDDGGVVLPAVRRVYSASVLDFDFSEPINRANPDTSGLQMLIAPALGLGLGQIDLVRRSRFSPLGDLALIHDATYGRAWAHTDGRLAGPGTWSTTRAYTMAAMIRPTALGLDFAGTLIRYGEQILFVDISRLYVLPKQIIEGVPTFNSISSDLDVLVNDRWNLVAVTFDGDETIRLWVDGSVVATGTRPDHVVSSPANIQIGAGNGASDTAWPFIGDIAGVAIWSRELAASDLARLSQPEGWLGLLNPQRKQRYLKHNLVPAGASLDAVCTLAETHHVRAHADASLDAVGTLAETHHIRTHAEASLDAVGTLSAAGEAIDPPSAATLSAVGTLAETHHIRTHAEASLNAVGTLSAAGFVSDATTTTLAAVGTLTIGPGIGPVILASATLSAVGTLTAAGNATQTYAWADFELPSWGEFPDGLETTGTGVSASQVTSGAFPDRGSTSMQITCTGVAGGAWVQVHLSAAKAQTYTRILLNKGTVTGSGAIVIAEAFDDSDPTPVSVWALEWTPSTGELELILPGAISIYAQLIGLTWETIEVRYDAEGVAELHINGRLQDSVSDEELEDYEVASVAIGALGGAGSFTGVYLLDELRVSSHCVGPVLVKPTVQNMSDPARWVVLVNADEPASVAYANEICAAREIPFANVVYVYAGEIDDPPLDETGFETIFTELLSRIESHNYQGVINGVIVAPEFPEHGEIDLGAEIASWIPTLIALGDGSIDATPNPRYLAGVVDVADLPARSSLLSGPFLVAQSFSGDASRAAALLDDQGDMRFSALDSADRLKLINSSGTWPTLDAFIGTLSAQKLMVQATLAEGFGYAIDLSDDEPTDFDAVNQTRALYGSTYPSRTWPALAAGYAYALSADEPLDMPNPAALFAALRAGWTWAEALAVSTPTLGSSLVALGDALGCLLTPKAGYNVYARETPGEAAELVACVPASVTTVRLDGFAPGDTRHFEVKAVSKSGRIDTEPQRLVKGRFASDTGIMALAAPNSPSSVKLERKAGGNILVTWSYLPVKEAAKCHVFRVYVATGASPTWNFATPTASLTIKGQLRQGYSVTVGPHADGTIVNVIVRSESAAGGVDNNTFAAQITADASAPAAINDMEVTVD